MNLPTPPLSVHASRLRGSVLTRPFVVDVSLVASLVAYALYRVVKNAGLEASFDELLHMFISSIKPITRMWMEVKLDAHPPLVYMLTRICMSMGDSLMWPRIVSIVPALVMIALLYACLRSLGVWRPLCFWAILFFATSPAFGYVTMGIRAYAFATMAVLAIVKLLISLLVLPEQWTRGKTRLLLACLLAAPWSLWASLFPIFCLSLTWFAAVLVSRDLRQRLWRVRRTWLVVPEWGCFALCLAAMVYWYFKSLGRTLGHLASRFPGQDESLLHFAQRSFASEAVQLTAIRFLDDRLLVVATLAFALCASMVMARHLCNVDGKVRIRGLLVLVGLELTTLMFLLSLVSIYPFGGELRHQFVLLPFFVLSATFLLEVIHRLLTRHVPRVAFVALVLGATVMLAMNAQPMYKSLPNRIWRRYYITLCAAANLDVLYLTQYHFLGFYENERTATWEHVRRVTCECDLYHATRNGVTRQVYRANNMLESIEVRLDEPFFTRLHDVLAREHLPAVWVVWSPSPFAWHPGEDELSELLDLDAVGELLKSLHLIIDKCVSMHEWTIFRARLAS